MNTATLMNINTEPSDLELKKIMSEVATEAKAKYLVAKKMQEKLIRDGIEKLNKSEKA